jgi:hypothetical protein
VIANPKPGQRVELRYRESLRAICPRGARGVVIVAGCGRPRNHMVRLDDGREMIVPCGHMIKEVPV